MHFTVITSNPAAIAVATEEQLREEVRILYEYFVTASREKIVGFVFKSATFYDEIDELGCDLVAMSNDSSEHTSDEWEDAVNACTRDEVVDPRAINFFVYDSCAAGSYADVTSRGRLNSYHPYVLIDWERLNHTTQSPEEHEMGHAFGLGHVCDPTATATSSTNIMATGNDYVNAAGALVDCPGSGGLRDRGFNEEQETTILTNAALIKAALGAT